MNSLLIDQLETGVNQLLAHQPLEKSKSAPEIEPLLAIAAELRYLPHPQFRERLAADLRLEAQQRSLSMAAWDRPSNAKLRVPRESVLPPLFTITSGSFPVRGSHLVVSFTLHVAALVAVAASSWWVVENRAAVRSTVADLIPTDIYLLPPARSAAGGGGGGDHDKLAASHGTPPRFSSEQLTPPAVVVRNSNPEFAAEPTVVGPPDIVLPQSSQPGDPVSRILAPPSNGTGSRGGIGSGEGGGVGAGNGPGVGDGRGGGIGGGLFTVGAGVSAPRAIYQPDPEYSEEARKAKFQGNVVLWAIIGADGRPRDLRVARSLGMGLDQKALDAVSKWRFEPATKDGHPVAVQVNIEVAFHLY